jgi:hypothetical protein
MIVAIVNQTVPVGRVKVDEFRVAVDEAAAVAAYAASYNPPRNPLDYLGFDTGWVAYVSPTQPSSVWAYDFGAPGLVEVSSPGGLEPFSAEVLTVDATPTVITAFATADNIVYGIEAWVTARRIDGTPKGFGTRIAGTFRRGTGAASLVQVGVTTVLYAHLEAPILWTASFVANIATGDIEVVVTGSAAPITWNVYGDSIQV